MNPPSALHGAMSRDRKPFTYTPGGLDLSEIKSERMAKRLMRNAMNQGVPEKPTQMIQSPPMPSTPVTVPNYNCLPVQVFPTFNLPANPKSLLRTRSNPDQPKDFPIQTRVPTTHFVNKSSIDGREYQDTFNKITPTAYTQINNNRPVSMYEYNAAPSNVHTLPRTNYGSDGHTLPGLPEISYEAEYLQAPRKIKTGIIKLPSEIIKEEKISVLKNGNNESVCLDIPIEPPLEKTDCVPIISKSIEDEADTDNKQKEVKIVKKQVKKEQKIENQNGDENGHADLEAELTVKLPTKKSGAKTETKVEVVEKTLPDGSVQEIKTTTTKTTIDGKTEITTKTETKTIPKEEDEEEEVVEEEEEEEETGEVVVEEVQDEKVEEELIEKPKSSIKENGHESNIVKTEERSETTTTKKVVVVQNTAEEEPEEEVEEEEEIVEEAEPVTVVIKKPVETTTVQEDINEVEEEEIEEEEELAEKEEDIEKVKLEKIQTIEQKAEEVEEVEEEEVEEEEEEEMEVKKEENNIQEKVEPAQKDEEEEVEEEEVKEDIDQEKRVQKDENKNESPEKPNEEDEEVEEVEEKEEDSVENPANEPEVPPKEKIKVQVTVEKEKPVEVKQLSTKEAPTVAPQVEHNIPLREPSIPLEKVEDVEIKPIGLPSATISKSHTENTEIKTSTSPYGQHGTQTEYNKIENIVTVNRTTKILDHSYENLTQQGIPTVKTYFPPSSRDRVLASPLPSRPYQPVYPPEPQTERRHSLLLERLSMERQMPSDINQNNYQYTNQAYEEQRQFSQEPQSEVLTVSNVKPSAIKNQDWFQQSRRENIIYNNLIPSTPAPPPPTTPLWSQQQTRPQPQPQSQPQPPVQQYVPPQPQYQPSYTETIAQDRSNTYQQNTYQENTYTPYTPKPTWGSNVINLDSSINTPSPHPYASKDTTDSYQSSTQQYSSSYVPPPWEQDSSYVVDNSNKNYYQPPTPTTTYTPTQNQSWNPAPVSNKYTKPTPTAYIPPAPNQSFVMPVTVEPPRLPGRKTYYSEYERRYISVPEATYIPGETKYQPQPDPSPQYYYDNNEPNEVVEHEWRKELREFTEKSTKTEQKIEQTNVNPPWEAEDKYAKTLPTTYTTTPTWSQTVRPRSWRERSYDAEYIGSQEFPKTNTLGRGRPLSSTYGKTSIDAPIPERTRGVSVDRYNPNNYQSPISAEHPPVQSHTLTTPAPHATYHNPNVPSYHARASAEPRGQPVYPQSRTYREPQPSPFQSRSFKYLQWITGTED